MLDSRILIAGLLTFTACAPSQGDETPAALFDALASGHALDGRRGLDLYRPEDWHEVLEETLASARYWGRDPGDQERLESILARHATNELGKGNARGDRGLLELYSDLLRFQEEVMTFTEAYTEPGLRDLAVEGDRARAYRITVNPGGEVREPVEFLRVDGSWYLCRP